MNDVILLLRTLQDGPGAQPLVSSKPDSFNPWYQGERVIRIATQPPGWSLTLEWTSH